MKHASPATFAPDLSKPSKEGLIFALRNLNTVLPGVVWNYEDPRGCACGVAARLWEPTREWIPPGELGLEIGIGKFMAIYIFAGIRFFWNSKTTAEMVADALERL